LSFRDPRFNSESIAYTEFIRNGFPQPTDLTIEAIRKRTQALHEKVNEKLIGTFKGKEEEKKVKIYGNTGKILNKFFKK
jgi:hypothetical protein